MNTDPKPVSGDNKRAHLAMIQGVIDRMGGNLFFLRGWVITLMAALFAATISFSTNPYLQMTLAGAVLFFWGIDAYFLSLERCYRDLYDAVRRKNEDDVDFSMDCRDFRKFAKDTWLGSFFSPTLLWFYVPLTIAMSIVVFLTNQ